MKNRSCGDCTICCEGWLSGEAHGHKFWPGRKCYFVTKKGCSIYEDRPSVCRDFNCLWVSEDLLPNWMQPNLSKVMCYYMTRDGIKYLKAVETGQKMDSEVLSYLISLCVKEQINIQWQVNGGYYHLGSQEFCEVMDRKFVKEVKEGWQSG